MRPLKLTFAGVRSYRGETTVEFSDRSLVAVIGDTGAGKSSLLEAITYALYGSSTWSKQPGDLISHATGIMRVTLDFEADGRRWSVTRSMSASGYPPPVHHLECAESGERYNSRRDVNTRIEELIGLDYDGFLRAVILPQGKFDQLLMATKADRDATLKNIFRVDQLEQVREAAKQLFAELEPKRAALVQRRGDFLPDPEAEAAMREDDLQAAEQRVQALESAQRAANDARTRRDNAARAVERLRLVQRRLPDPDDAAALPQQLRELEVRRQELDQQIGPAENERAKHEKRLSEVDRELQKRADDGSDAAALAAAREVLSALTDEHQAVMALLRDLAAKRQESSEDRAELERTDSLIRTKAEEAREADTHVEKADARAKETDRLLREVTRAVEDLLAEARRADGADERLRNASESVEHKEAAAKAAFAGSEAVAQDLDAAEQRLVTVRRADAAAHAAHGLMPGDECPICNRALDDGFVPPEIEGLEAATETAAQVKKKSVAAQMQLTKASGEAEAATATLRSAEAAHDELVESVASRLAAVHEHVTATKPEPKRTRPSLADVRADDGVSVLEPFRVAASGAQTALATARDAAKQAGDAVVALKASRNAAAKSVEQQQREIDQLHEAASSGTARLTTRVAALDSRWRPPVPFLTAALDASEADIDDLPALDPADALDAIAALEGRLASLVAERRDAEDALREARSAYDAIQRQRRNEVESPAISLTADTNNLSTKLGEACEDLAIAGPPGLPADPSDLAVLATWAESASALVAALYEAAAQQLDAAATDHAGADRRLTAALASADVDSIDALGTALATSMAARDRVAETLTEAQRQIPVVRELDRRITQGQEFLELVQLVRTKLAPGAFIGHLINLRQHALLGVASTMLSEITNGRYGFSSDFDIFDQLSGQPRSPRTLSGGETFLASLALALAMVELAARAGGRLDALFLDEGFGALDLDNLEAAVDALEARAQASRLVVVITHVMAVAERIPAVLAVYDKANSSHVAWLDETQRQIAANTDVEAELSKTLTRLLR